jgi:hypothetical protein
MGLDPDILAGFNRSGTERAEIGREGEKGEEEEWGSGTEDDRIMAGQNHEAGSRPRTR